ncbi:MAG TPA: flavodoxin domain-containing protein [Mycobacteriales bacterium]|nr:flavodoxin domain-containing protein [Mycobacteriales bacterium]
MDAVRVLVVYGSTRGGTAGLAHLLADAFVRHHIHAEVRRAGEVRVLSDDYDAVIVGGALYNNRWHPDASVFVGRHRAALRQLPVWFFSSGPLDDSARSGALAPVPQVTSLAREVEVRGHMTFGGLLDKRPGGLLGLFAYGPEGDFRDRRQVAEWAARIADELDHEHESMVRVVDSHGRVVTPAAVTVTPAPPPASTPEPELAEVVDLRREEDAERPGQAPARPAGGFSRLRHYLVLDDEEADEDDGLDLLLEGAEP